MSASRASLYRATLVAVVPDGRDGKGNDRYLLTVNARALDGTAREVTVRTRGYVRQDVEAVEPGDLVNVIRDGRGSAVVIERTGA